VADNELNIGRLEGKIDGITSKLDHLTKQIDGNGQKGLFERTVSLEECVQAHCNAQEAMVQDLIKQFTDSQENLEANQKEVRGSLSELKKSVDLHFADKSLHTIWGQVTWKGAGIVVAVVAIITLIIPPNITVWDLVSKLVGLK